MQFKLNSEFKPSGDQPQAIENLYRGLSAGLKNQVLLGVTGSGKTFTMANLIEKCQKPVLVISHNKTLAAQLYQEFKEYFPENAVSYFVSYYDYYQPEAYIPQTDTYIEKETEVNDEIDKLRLAATTNLLTRKDTIIVASVSCIYNIGSPTQYGHFVLELKSGMRVSRESIVSRLVDLQYIRSNYDFKRSTFRIRGENIDIYPAYEDTALRIMIGNEKITGMEKLDPLNGKKIEEINTLAIYPAKHYMTDPGKYREVFEVIRRDLKDQVARLKKDGKEIEAYRLQKRVTYDLEMINEVGYVNGIENYSRYFDGRKPGDPPYSLLDYFRHPYNDDWLLFIDESHITVPQIRGMYNGDFSRKSTLIDFGFRLPAALDNRPLKFTEFMQRIPNTVYVSATPDEWELSMAADAAGQHSMTDYRGVAEQLIRPTGIVDPKIEVRPTKGQITDLISEIVARKKMKERVLVTALTKRIAEDLSTFLNEKKYLKYEEFRSLTPDELPVVHYLHADIETLERSDILDDLRLGTYDVVIGINLLREGLDLPEVSLVAILDADKEGFLRSRTSLIQTMGRAARRTDSLVILYADRMTDSMKAAVSEVERRRQVQTEFNEKHGITPQSITKKIREKLVDAKEDEKEDSLEGAEELISVSEAQLGQMVPADRKKMTKNLEKLMRQAAADLNFELAAQLRDKIRKIKHMYL